MKVELQRRQFMSVLIGLGAANLLAVPSRAVGAAPAPGPTALQSVRRVGEAYLRLRPVESERKRLIAALFRDLRKTCNNVPAGDSASHLNSELRALVEDDFASGRTVILDGWVLSESECRLCALHVMG